MYFWLQEYNGKLDIDTRILRDELDKQKYTHQYTITDINTMDYAIRTGKRRINEIIPVGSLEFVGRFLNSVYGIENMNPIEVPNVLRKDEFLKRKYSISDEVPKLGRFFVKNASRLKAFSYAGSLEHITEEERLKYILLGDMYQVSELVDIVSEYRVFVHNDKILAINYYDGDCTVFPDISTIRAMVGTYMLDKNRPAAYTMDVAVIRDRGTAILEVHQWVSVGLYGYMFGSDLPYCYKDGLQYYIEKNKKVEKYKNF